MIFRAKRLILVVALSPWGICAQEQAISSPKETKDSVPKTLNEVVVSARQMLGSKFEASNRTGSAYYVSPLEIAKFGYTDISRMLKAVPGVNIYEEDGFGLRPNISLRGTKAERSERITLMEDGILAAPAPYSAPAAYYFPNSARMYAIEVLKGSSQVQYGPFTTGGAVNMVSTPIPNKFTANLRASYGSYNTFNTYAQVGNKYRYIGYSVEYLRHQSKGFRKDDPDERTGFKRNDLIAKFRVNTDELEDIRHAVEFKFGYANEHSDETYLGLTETDFSRNPYFRYAGAQMDNMRTKHNQYVVTYLLDIHNNFKLTTSGYYNYFYRNWYKLDDVRIGNTSDEKRTITHILEDPETNAAYLQLIKGERDYLGEALMVRANQRRYHSRGIQTKAEFRTRLWGGYLNMEFGARYHADMEDRFQWDDSYSMAGGRMTLFLAGLPGSQSNRITTAHAWSSYVLGKWSRNRWTITTGLRYENVALRLRDYTKKDLRRTGHERIEIPNYAVALLPSLGVSYKILPALSVFSGLHRGFAPPSASYYQKPESSINFELGMRYTTEDLKAEAIAFYNDYSNMLGSDLAAVGGQGTLDQFSIGAAWVRGAELMLQYQPIPKSWGFRLPLQISYTFTDTEMKNRFTSSAWGEVAQGDEIPYIYRHALNTQVGFEMGRFEANLGVRYNGDMRTAPGQGPIAEREKVPAHIILDASLKARINKHLTLTVNAINLANQKYIVSRHPSGVRAGHPFGIYAGVRIQL